MTTIQEDLEYRSIALSIKAAKITERILAKAMVAVIRKTKQAKNTPVVGKQSIKELAKGGTLSNIEITDKNIKNFDPVARKYGINYALQKDSSSEPPRWLVFFRAKDIDAITAAFNEYYKSAVKRDKDKPSVKETIKESRDTAKDNIKDKVRNKYQGEHTL